MLPLTSRYAPGRFMRRLGWLLGQLALAALLTGCLVSDDRIELGPRVQPLEAGLYVSFGRDGEPQEAALVYIDADGVYVHEDFFLAFYRSDLGEDVYFAAYTDREKGHTLYGVVEAKDGVLNYPGVTCEDVPEEARTAANFGDHREGCLLESAEQARAALTAFWRAVSRDRGWTRYVRQTEFRR